ncbi:oxygenase MpaB family protein [Pelagovum pacificum]|uniref:DUF2236 domain-containing protein n=1 Tax=Pelagovum pacificum TaxID=2588711 RepID=A0A5C5G7L6_9RHOB|nr:oxygenase MpaB family protein [Pelagovum pacificum]QQA41805.1 DUF2236 domain-containing protein [Pelagovum pacificum]TNY30753.1 DUF2236 domain-containing protein [Pelagovum pacificum]
MRRSAWAREIETLDPEVDFERIGYLLATCEFAWDTEKALQFALFRTYAVPSISGLLSRTGEFSRRPLKRYDDTELLLAEVAENGLGSDRGRAAVDRMNDMHGRYRIANADMVYVLSTFVLEPVRWLQRYGKRPLTEREKRAGLIYYRDLGARMGIRDMPESLDAFDTFNRAYEAEHFRYADSNAEIGCATRDLLMSFYLPRRLARIGHPFIYALMDDPLREAMGFPRPPRWIVGLVKGGLRLRAQALRVLPARRKPRLVTRKRRVGYPGGYDIASLGTFKTPASR